MDRIDRMGAAEGLDCGLRRNDGGTIGGHGGPSPHPRPPPSRRGREPAPCHYLVKFATFIREGSNLIRGMIWLTSQCRGAAAELPRGVPVWRHGEW